MKTNSNYKLVEAGLQETLDKYDKKEGVDDVVHCNKG